MKVIAIDYSFVNTWQHSYSDSKCTCDFMKSSFGDKSECAANAEYISMNSSIGFVLSAYFILGAEVAVSIDLRAWEAELRKKFDESMEYGK